MKAFFSTLFFALFASFALAGSISGGGEPQGQTPASSPFYFDEAKVSAATQGLSDLEALVSEKDLTLEQLKAENAELVENLKLDGNASIDAFGPAVEGPAGIPSFFWGLCLGAIGLLIVYIVTEDNDELKKALWGCLAAAGLYVLFWVVYILVLGNAWWWA